MNALYHVDHYDSFTYLIVAPISFIASILFAAITLSVKEARKFPGNLLIFVSLAEAGLCLHWFATALMTPYILGMQEPNDHDLLCEVNSLFAFTFATTELLFHFSFLLSIIVMFRNTMKKVKFLNAFWVFPLVALGAVVYGAILRETLGKNIYGSCSVKQMTHTGKAYLFINGAVVLLSFWAILTIRRFRKSMKKAGRKDDQFYHFYINYITLIMVFYLLIGVLYILAGRILECTQEKGEQKSCFLMFYLARMINNLKVFVPLIGLIFRLQDPFLQSLMTKFWDGSAKADTRLQSTGSKQSILSESSVNLVDDFVLNQRVKEVRQMIAKTLLIGVHRYFETWIQQYNNGTDASVLENLENELSPADEPEAATLPSSDRDINLNQSQGPDRFYQCSITSHHSKLFIGIIGAENLSEVHKSFDIKLNWEMIRKSEEQSGGSGGEFFLCTHDKRYFIKTMTKKEMRTFDSVVKKYADHMTSAYGSYITRIIGLFTFRFENSAKQTRLFVMENVFGTEKSMIDRMYDLKGSTYSRQVLIQSRDQLLRLKKTKIKETLKDIDFNNIDSCLRLPSESREYLLAVLKRDVEFFRECRLIDYSLILGLIEVENLTYEQVAKLEQLAAARRAFFNDSRSIVFIPGIIDFFQLYTFGKMTEKYFKKIKKMEWGLETSSQPPDYYASRFEAYMKVIFC